MKRSEFYRLAFANLGWLSTAKRQFRRRFSSSGDLFRLTSKHLRFPVWCRSGGSDLAVFDQIFLEREYRCLDDLADCRLILDCGANVGYSAAYLLSRFPNAFVVSVEPDEANFAMLLRNLAPYQGRYLALRGAVWSERATLRIDSGDGEWGRTVGSGEGGPDAGQPVEAYPVDALLAMSGHSAISLLKMDIEGSEAEVFRQGYESWLEKTANIVIELHGGECDARFFSAIGDAFAISTCGELTVCTRRSDR